MLSKSKLAFVCGMAILAQSAFAAGSEATRSVHTAVPKGAIESVCRDAQVAAMPESRSIAYDSCVRDERSAYDKLQQGWSNYSAAARETCAEPGDGVPFSYVELLTCLEMQPGGSLTVQGPAPDGIGSSDIMASPSPQAGESLGSDSLHSPDSVPLPAP
jgi:hypothetical protein